MSLTTFIYFVIYFVDLRVAVHLFGGQTLRFSHLRRAILASRRHPVTPPQVLLHGEVDWTHCDRVP